MNIEYNYSFLLRTVVHTVGELSESHERNVKMLRRRNVNGEMTRRWSGSATRAGTHWERSSQGASAKALPIPFLYALDGARVWFLRRCGLRKAREAMIDRMARCCVVGVMDIVSISSSRSRWGAPLAGARARAGYLKGWCVYGKVLKGKGRKKRRRRRETPERRRMSGMSGCQVDGAADVINRMPSTAAQAPHPPAPALQRHE
jgi:hypothetical protein